MTSSLQPCPCAVCSAWLGPHAAYAGPAPVHRAGVHSDHRSSWASV